MWRNWRALAHTTPCNQWNHPFVHHFCVCACGNWSAFPYFDSERRDLDSHGPARSHRLRGDRPGEQGRGQELRSFYTKRVCVVCHLQRSPAPCRSWTTITPETSNSYAPSSTPWRRNSLEDASGASYDAGNAIISGTSAWIVLFVPGGVGNNHNGTTTLGKKRPLLLLAERPNHPRTREVSRPRARTKNPHKNLLQYENWIHLGMARLFSDDAQRSDRECNFGCEVTGRTEIEPSGCSTGEAGIRKFSRLWTKPQQSLPRPKPCTVLLRS